MNLLLCMIALALPGNDKPAPANSVPETCHSTCGAAPTPLATRADLEAEEVWPLTLRKAIGISLDTSEITRVISLGDGGISNVGCRAFDTGPEPPPKPPLPAGVPDDVRNDPQAIIIARLNADAARFRFKCEMMAHIRSVEQTYWNLGQAHVALWAADKAERNAREVVEILTDLELPCCRADELASASERLDQFSQRLADRTSDVITAERLLRNILGLPQSDNRRIVPVTPPTEAGIAPDWQTCVAAMMHAQPDIVQQKSLTRVAELELALARHPELPQVNLISLYQMNALGETLDSAEETLMSIFRDGLDLGTTKKQERLDSRFAQPSSDADDVLALLANEPTPVIQLRLANTRKAQYGLLRARGFLRQVVHQSTHTLAKRFLEVDRSYQNFATADRLYRAANRRLETGRADWDDGLITTDNWLDVVEQFEKAVVERAKSLASYNASIACLSECKGTLLADHHIFVLEPGGPAAAKQATEKVQDDQARKVAFAESKTQSPKPTFVKSK